MKNLKLMEGDLQYNLLLPDVDKKPIKKTG